MYVSLDFCLNSLSISIFATLIISWTYLSIQEGPSMVYHSIKVGFARQQLHRRPPDSHQVPCVKSRGLGEASLLSL